MPRWCVHFIDSAGGNGECMQNVYFPRVQHVRVAWVAPHTLLPESRERGGLRGVLCVGEARQRAVGLKLLVDGSSIVAQLRTDTATSALLHARLQTKKR